MKITRRNFLKGLGAVVGATVVSTVIPGCETREEYEEGVVIKEFGTLMGFVKSEGALFGNDSVKIGELTYGVRVKAPAGIYTISIYPTCNRTLEALESAIEEGTRVKFAKYKVFQDRVSVQFGSDKIGKISADDIQVLGKE